MKEWKQVQEECMKETDEYLLNWWTEEFVLVIKI